MKCIKVIVNINCQHCEGATIKFGKVNNKQRYRCKKCNKTQFQSYLNCACQASVDSNIAAHVKEGCGIRSIARLLHISATTVISRIQKIAESIKRPVISTQKTYEVDELKTYIKRKTNDYWIIYALEKESKQVVDFKVGKRNKKNIKRVTDTLLLAECKKINTDGLDIYGFVIPQEIHRVKRYATNHIERKNLTMRTNLKRLSRKTLCFSKSLLMLEACVKIFFWFNVIAP